MEGMGFSKSEIVTKIAQDHKCSLRTVQRDFKNRGEWQPIAETIEDQRYALFETVNCLKYIYRKASVKCLSATNESVQLGWAKLMADLRVKIYDL